MKAKEFWAQTFAKRWSKPSPEKAERDALAHAHLKGFELALKHAAEMLEQLGGPKGVGLAVLVQAIGTAEVDKETGERLA